jgi:hypothetical protein
MGASRGEETLPIQPSDNPNRIVFELPMHQTATFHSVGQLLTGGR